MRPPNEMSDEELLSEFSELGYTVEFNDSEGRYDLRNISTGHLMGPLDDIIVLSIFDKTAMFRLGDLLVELEFRKAQP